MIIGIALRISAILLATTAVLPAYPSAADFAPGLCTGTIKVVKTWKLGGDGGWDYLTADSANHRLFIARATRVMVVDTESGKQIGEIADTPGVHGVALDPETGRGFTSNGRENTVSMFDLKSLAVEKKIKVGSGPDAILYDPFSKRVFTFNGKGDERSATAVDASKGEVVGKIELGGKPEFAATDEKGTVFVNIEDTSELVALDPQKLTVKSRWKLTGCEEPTGLSIDLKNRRLFAGCGGNKKMVVVDADNGKYVAAPSIGEGCDATAFDADRGLAFASAGDGTITVIKEDVPRPVQRGADGYDAKIGLDHGARFEDASVVHRGRKCRTATGEKSGARFLRGAGVGGGALGWVPAAILPPLHALI